MQQIGNEIHSYFVVFTNEARLGLFSRLFTREGFRHCELLMAIGDGSVGVVHNVANVQIIFYKENVFQALEKLLAKGCTIVYLQTVSKPRKIRLGLFVPSCVSTCMKVTGVSFNAVTPYGYYKSLIKHGAKRYGIDEAKGAK
jgi:hypothetical protein